MDVRRENLTHLKMFVGGKWIDAAGGETIESCQPGDGVPWATIPAATQADVDRAVGIAREAFVKGEWSRATPAVRAKLLQKLADLMSQESIQQKMADLETREWGRIRRDAIPVVKAFVEQLHFCSSGAAVMVEASRSLESASLHNLEKRIPLGVIAAILPWNSPLTLAGYKIIPALLMGNSVVAKPSEFSSAPLLELASLFKQVGLPDGVLNVVTGDGRAGECLANHPGIDKLTFTGSVEVGIEVYKRLAPNLTRAMFELGGKSANIIFADANLERATNAALSIFRSAGQACLAPSRLLVESTVYDEVLEQIKLKTRALKVGDPWDPEVTMGPVRNPRQLNKILGHIRRAQEDGAILLTGGERPDLPRRLQEGWYVQPTVFTDVRPGTALEQQEIFGPVLAVMKFSGEEEALSIANGTKYGLAAAAWTRDFSRAHRMANLLEAGTVWINTYYQLSPRVPFGGVKKSGIGREGGLQVFAEFSDVRNAVMELSD